MTALSPVILEILNSRGIIDVEDIEEFLSTKPKLTYDPLLLYGMKEGVDFVIRALDNEEHICIYGDYDVDGITASALLYNFLSGLTSKITYFIPSRFEEGYGLNKDVLSRLRKDGIDSIITVDCGSISRDEISHATSIGLNVLVTDHHEMKQDTIPDCVIINPKHEESKYPFEGLCGCGVAFKLVQAIVKTKQLSRDILREYLDLVAIATIADVVPLIDENRTMVKYGLKELNKLNRKALRVLINKLGIEHGTIDAYKISFIIAPHMNAAGRMKDANLVVQMLISDDNLEIERIADMLIEHNNERKAIQDKCMEESVRIVEKEMMGAPILLVIPDFVHEGIAGIVAGKLKEKFNKPTIVLSKSDNGGNDTILKGSGRSIDGVNLSEILKRHKELFIKVGGHAMAAGFSIHECNFIKLKEALIGEMKDMLRRNPKLLTRKSRFDIIVDPHEINLSLAKDIDLLAPFGQDNPSPVFKLQDAAINKVRYMGDENQHVKFAVEGFDCIMFGYEIEDKKLLESGNDIDIYGAPGINSWNSRDNLQFMVKAIESGKE